MVMFYYQRHIGDYAKDTGHLSLLEHGVYTVLLDWCYNAERPLPDDDAAILRMCRARTPAEKRAVLAVVNEFFPRGADGRWCKRVKREIALLVKKSDAAREAAAKRWQCKRNATALPEHSEGNAIQDSKTPRTNILSEGGGVQVGDDEILAFGRNFKGEAASGAPAMPDDWIYDFLKRINGRRDWPRDWRTFMVACWRTEFRTWGTGGNSPNQKTGAQKVAARLDEHAGPSKAREL